MKEDTFSEKILRVLKEGVTQYGSATALAKAAGVSNANLSRWINKIQSPRMSEISPLLDVLKINITKPDAEASRDVCFVNAKVVPAGNMPHHRWPKTILRPLWWVRWGPDRAICRRMRSRAGSWPTRTFPLSGTAEICRRGNRADVHVHAAHAEPRATSCLLTAMIAT